MKIGPGDVKLLKRTYLLRPFGLPVLTPAVGCQTRYSISPATDQGPQLVGFKFAVTVGIQSVELLAHELQEFGF
jgi:hypothetical protein